ncbi:MAG: DsbA family protein [Rhodospirillales bacterium]|nr:DsbA family protein [Rhodospirillales bacterium]
MTRFVVFLLFFAPLVAMMNPANASDDALLQERIGERVLGNADAPVTIIEYSSLTCPHCAKFHAETLPRIKKKYIENGKAKLVFRDFPFDRVGLAAATIARCVPQERYFGFIDILFASQGKWSSAPNPIEAVAQFARFAGLSPELIDACLGNEKIVDAIINRRVEGEKTHGIQSTPSFVINGTKVSGALPFEEFDKVIAKALGGS